MQENDTFLEDFRVVVEVFTNATIVIVYPQVHCKPQSPPPFNCVLIQVGDHGLHSSIPFTCVITTDGNGRSGVYNIFFFY